MCFTTKQSYALCSWDYASTAWQRLHIDYAGPFLGQSVLIVVDAYSKWSEIFQNLVFS